MNLPPQTARIVFLARGWTRTENPTLMLDEDDLYIRWFSELAIASFQFITSAEGTIRLSADSIPTMLTLRSFVGPLLPGPASVVSPVSLLVKPHVSCKDIEERKRQVALYLSAEQFDLAIAEAADAWLAGNSAERTAVASLIIDHLGRHPLLRPDSVGALLATFCVT